LLATSSTQILLNGFPGELIRHRRGLRQGDPLSPMLFVLVMDVLSSLFRVSEEKQLLSSLEGAIVKSRLSLYADDVVLFVKPRVEELNCVKLILDCFGEASGLVTNLHKSCAIPIRCEDDLLQEGCNILQCTPSSFPCTYLGLPISDKKLSRNILMTWVDKIADRLPNWKARLLNLAGRTALVRFVLSAIPVYLFLAMNIPKWVIHKIDKIRKGFVWRGRKEVNGGSCLVAWDSVTRPLKYGGLGIPNLQHMCWALQDKWLWLQKTDRDRPWHGLSIPIQQHVKDLFAASLISHVGNGSNTLFWTDK
jgi:hypothetical protein